MKYEQMTFRDVFDNNFAIPIDGYERQLEDFAGFEDADSLLVYGYIDHQNGMMLEVLAKGYKTDNGYVFDEPDNTVSCKIRLEDEKDLELTEVEIDEDRYADKYASLYIYGKNESINKTRWNRDVDEFRDRYHPDDVRVVLVKDGLNMETCWVRMDDVFEDVITGTLLSTPVQDFSLSEGDAVSFTVMEFEDGEKLAVCELNSYGWHYTREELEDGEMLRNAIAGLNEDPSEDNIMAVLQLLRDSNIWVPCRPAFSERDKKTMERIYRERKRRNDPTYGATLTNKDEVRMIPDILESDDGKLFFPAFTSVKEMGDYGDEFNKIPAGFLEIMHMAENHELDLTGIVVNPFSEAYAIDRKYFSVIASMPSGIIEDNTLDDLLN